MLRDQVPVAVNSQRPADVLDQSSESPQVAMEEGQNSIRNEQAIY